MTKNMASGEIKYRQDFTTQWAYYIFIALIKVLFAVHLKLCSFYSLTDVCLIHVNILSTCNALQCMFALSLCAYNYVHGKITSLKFESNFSIF